MAGRAIKVRIVVRRPAEFVGLFVSVIAHSFGLAAVLGVFSSAPPVRASKPSLAVTLAGPRLASSSPRSGPQPAPAPAPKPPPGAPIDKPTQAPARSKPPVEIKPSERSIAKPVHERADPTQVDHDPEPTPPTPSTATPEPSTTVKPDPAHELPAGPIEGGVAGLDLGGGTVGEFYGRSVRDRLISEWVDRPPLPAGMAPPRVVVAFTIDKDGRISQIKIEEPSSYSLLDQSVLRLLRSIDRLPPIPRNLKRESISASFVFELSPGPS